ncbi:katanin-interacting protein-like [Mytilus californianus]|uniref:katanin-interacting protein-like n=1 Tax=Mytilus californianus TaxID=6549 RepID=UPI002246B1E7|nr:katanin-interacting protein-like [Mytilus californianus]
MDRYSKKKSPDDAAKRNLKAEAMQEVLPGYEEYLVLLQERNRLLKRLRKKSKKQIDIERKEQGFSIYVNGANTEMLAKKQKSHAHQETPQDDRPTSGRLKTAGDVSNKRVLNLEDLNAISQMERQKMAERNRAKTAPARERRRNWQAASVEIKTERGENRRIKAPEMITGNYEDDFEDEDDDDDYDDSDDEQQMRASMSQYLSDDDSDSDIEIDASRHNRFNKFKSPPKKNTAAINEGIKKKGKPLAKEEGRNEKLELSISDVKKLRQSLCMNASIRESLAKEVSSEEELSDRESPIPEEDEDIMEDLVPATESVEEKKAPVFKPTDTIVLELALPQQTKKVQHNLSAARKKDIDDDTNGYRPHRKDPIPSSPRGQKSKVDSVLQANVPSRSKQERPLSANRRNQPEKVDTNEEASAVMAALKAENEKASKLIRNTPSTPDRSKPRPSSLNPQRKSVEARPMRTPTKDKSEVRDSRNVSRSKDGPSVRKSQQVRESIQGRESVNVPQSPRQETSESFLKNDKLTEIMKKVLLMQPKQQKKLMTVLTKIESSVDNEPKQKPNTPVKATEPVNNMVNRQSKNVRSGKSRSPEEMTEVNIELVSTWGHKEQIGLTELQFFDKNRKLIPISTSNVTVHGARDNSNLVDVLFNGKGKTNKDRNMWCCRYKKGVPVEMCILLPVSSPELLSRVKIWNYNKSMQDLEIGVKHARIFIGGELVFDGVVEKGCGNQVFDYGFIINLNEMEDQPSPRSPKPSSPAHVSPTPPSRPTDVYSEPKVQHRPLPKPPSPARQSRTEKSVKASNEVSQRKVRKSTSPVGQSRNEDVIMTKPKPVKRNISNSPSPARPVSGSSNSSNESNQKPSRPLPQVRSETRTMNHSDRRLPKPVVSDRQGSDTEEYHKDESKLPGRHKGSRTPRKSKRMAAKLDGHSSTETDSRQFSDSADGRRSPLVQKEEMVSSQSALPSEPVHEPTTQYSAPPQSIKDPPSDHIAPLDPPSQHSTLSQSEDDIPMIQKLQQLNHKQQPDPSKKKGPPSWLKNEDLSGPFEGPPSSRQGTPVNQAPVKNDDHMYQTKQDDIDMLIDEELAMWPKTGKSELKTVFDADKVKPEPSKEDGKATPMQKIKENRSKWRENQKKNLEESWGSLTMFDRQQKGRISMDLDDDSLDEYLNPSKKQIPKEAPIQEEDDDLVDSILNEVPGDEDFIIPELPYGKSLVIDIISTWGDRHYVGLTGIQLFTSTGDAVTVSKISAEPSDINILDEYNKDPRVISNVLDGVNRTRDDVHMWLAPFTEGKHNYINLTFDKPCKIALMRIWNYNKSRIHSYRGAKYVIITLDKSEIFKGEIERACGGIEGGTEAFGDTILFTTDENILECVSRNDDAYEGEMFDSDEPDDVPFERPRTADAGDENRPFTRAVGNIDGSTSPLPPRPATSMVTEGDVIVFKGKKLLLSFTATWGDMHYLGLTGLEVVGRDGEALPVNINMMNGSPRDLHSLPGHENDDRTLDKVIDNNNLTTSDEHMWMIPFTEGQNHTLSIEFSQTQMISGLRVWNYNKSREDTYRGARIVHVTIDDKQVSPPEGYLIRKGPGVCHFDFAQEISFAPQTKPPQPTVSKSESKHLRKSTMSTDEASQEYENVQMPSGFIYQLQMITTWGDPYYVGLNGLEFYDAQHNRIELTENNISAYPDSVNVLDGTSNDVRTPDKLIDGFNDTLDGTHMWVAPILPGIVNRVYVIFDQPTTVSMIKLWNYSKTPSRGAKDFALLVDDLLVYNGNLQAVTQGARGIIPGVSAPQKYHTILFTDNKEILRKEKHTVISNQTGDQDIQLTNDKQVVSHYNDPKKAESGKPVNQQLRPKTSLVATKKRR